MVVMGERTTVSLDVVSFSNSSKVTVKVSSASNVEELVMGIDTRKLVSPKALKVSISLVAL